jgi:glutathione peroxidase
MPGRLIRFVLVVFLLFSGYVWFVNQESRNMTIRQKILKAVYPVFAGLQHVFKGQVRTHAPGDRKHPPVSLYNLAVKMNDGTEKSMSHWKGKKILLVNTASDCGYTAQYENLQALAERYPDKLVVIGFPANDFKEQEKGDDASIAAFCKINFGVRFPLAAKSSVVKGAIQNPVFHWLSDARQNGWNNRAPVWNFMKYLVDEEGRLVGVYEPAVDPMGSELKEAVEEVKSEK